MDPIFKGKDLAGLELIETFRRDPDGGFPHLAPHLQRLQASAARLGWRCDAQAVQDALAGLAPAPGPRRVRMVLNAASRIQVRDAELPPNPPCWRLALASTRLDSADPWLGIKSSRRAVYDRARAALPAGIDELLFRNERDELCEGTISNLFIRQNGRLLTPPLASGLLPGVLRRKLLESGAAAEAVLFALDLQRAEAVYMGNSLRGLIPAELAELPKV